MLAMPSSIVIATTLPTSYSWIIWLSFRTCIESKTFLRIVICLGGEMFMLCYWSIAIFLFSLALVPLTRRESFSASYWNDTTYKVAVKVLFSIFVRPMPSFLTFLWQVPVIKSPIDSKLYIFHTSSESASRFILTAKIFFFQFMIFFKIFILSNCLTIK